MPKDLIIVESPAKVRTLGKFLGKHYSVAASVGHVRDLPKSDLGVDESKDFAPNYVVIDGKKDVVDKLQKAAAKAGTVYLAPDPDREGEAIAWHVAELIKKKNSNIRRIQFNEITERAVRQALEQPRELNEELFDSQQARRILDRLVGYKLSPLLWDKVKRGISAGRVQSVALKLVVEREKERHAFTPEEYWPFKAVLSASEPPPFETDLWKVSGKNVRIGSAEQARELEESLAGKPFVVDKVEEKKRKRQPKPPYITSTMQQEANRRLGFSAKRTMSLAQRLYEGVDMGDKGSAGLITYMRTDSVRIANEARDAARAYILERFGKENYPAKPRVFKSKGGAQDAHEAVRPVDPALDPKTVKPFLDSDLHRLYTLIWERFIASQMAAAEILDTSATAACGHTLWRAKGERVLFPGFMLVAGGADKQTPQLPKMSQGDELTLEKLDKQQKFTQQPPRYSEATLVKELEEKGIGRPSTYAAIISTIVDREYVKLEEKRFAPTELGMLVSDQLCAHFPELMDVSFTAQMETKLDKVADGEQNWVDLLKNFTSGFYPTLDKAKEEMRKGGELTDVLCDKCGKPMQIRFARNGGEFLGCSAYPDCNGIKNFSRDENGKIIVQERVEDTPTDIACDKCGKPMVVKHGRMGDFLGCSGYPDCKNIKNFKKLEDGTIEVTEGEAREKVGTCPKCGQDLVVKRARSGSRFIACTGYPKCTYTEPFSTGVPCPMEGCDGELVEKSTRKGKVFFSCSRYPKCDYALWNPPKPGPCPVCGHPILVTKTTRQGTHTACPQKGCQYKSEE